MAFADFAKTPVFWSILLLFGGVFNYQVPDLGETYVSRNLGAWAIISLSLIFLWWRPFKKGELVWSPLWLGGLMAPVIGSFLLLATNIIAGFDHLHVGHYFLPMMLLTFGLFVLGMLQHQSNLLSLDLITITVFLAFLPQYGVYLATENPLITSLLPNSSFSLPVGFTKASAGFGQYNLLGSFIATLLIMTVAAFVLQPLKPARRLMLVTIILMITVDLPFVRSKTALLGILLGMLSIVAHVLFNRIDRSICRRLTVSSAVIIATYLSVIALAYLLGIEKELASRSIEANQSSFATRTTMWIIGFWGFWEKPLFGHGLGSFLSIYMDHFERYGVAAGFTYLALASIPHNLIIHILSETGLFGLLLVMGPFIWLGLRIFIQNKNRWLMLGLLLPILLHSQVEYPYIASGSHYWLFGLLLVVSQDGSLDKPSVTRRVIFTSRRLLRSAYSGLVAFALIGIFVTVSLTIDVRRSALAFVRGGALPLEQFIENRANAPDLWHPILGKRLRAIVNLQLIRKIFAEKRYELLRPVALPYFESHVLEDYPTLPVWKTAFEIYAVLEEDDKMLAIVNKIALYLPDEAKEFSAQYETYRRLKATRRQRQ